MMVVQIAMNNILRHYGAQSNYGSEIPLACAGIITKVNMIFFSLCIGISQGLQPIVSFNYGAEKIPSCAESLPESGGGSDDRFPVSRFYVFSCFPGRSSACLVPEQKSIFHFAEEYFRIFLFFTFINGLQPVSANFFTSIGKAGKGIFLSLTRQIIFLLPLIIILPMVMGHRRGDVLPHRSRILWLPYWSYTLCEKSWKELTVLAASEHDGSRMILQKLHD